MTIYFVTAMIHSSYGRGFLAVRDDEIAAEAIEHDLTISQQGIIKHMHLLNADIIGLECIRMLGQVQVVMDVVV